MNEDALAFNSPAAVLMASMGSHGLTPLPNGQEGLGITTDLRAIGAKEDSVLGMRTVEEERRRRLQEVHQTLKTRVAGRGVSRKGVENIARLSGFTYLWDEDNFSIAGNCVDLEIIFDPLQHDVASDVVLKINTSASEDHKQDDSQVLKQDLDPLSIGELGLPWNSLDSFTANLDRLAQLDHLSKGVNCFEAIGGLYQTFQKIWVEEKKRMRSRGTLARVCQGVLGRPAMNQNRKLGLSLDYWVENRRLLEAAMKSPKVDAMDVDQDDVEIDTHQDQPSLWTGSIICEAGYPPIRVANDWIADDIYNLDRAEDDSNEDNQMNDNGKVKLAWLDPPPTLVTSSGANNESNAMLIDGAGISIPKPPNIRFAFKLERAVLIPMNVASAMIAQGLTVPVDSRKALTYHQALENLTSPPNSSSTKNSNSIQVGKVGGSLSRPLRKSFSVFSSDGKGQQIRHSYAIYSNTTLWCYPLQSVSFEHPRQLASIMPILRQYALLWTMMRNLAPDPSTSAKESDAAEHVSNGAQSTDKRGASQRKSNINSRRAKLENLMREVDSHTTRASATLSEAGRKDDGFTPIDISLNLTSTILPKPKLDLIIPISGLVSRSNSKEKPQFGTVGIEVEADGEIQVSSAVGLPFAKSEGSLKQMAGVLSLSEDLGVFVEWIFGRLREK